MITTSTRNKKLQPKYPDFRYIIFWKTIRMSQSSKLDHEALSLDIVQEARYINSTKCQTHNCPRIIKLIREKLKMFRVESHFKASCFSHFLEMDPGMKVSGELLTELKKCQLDTESTKQSELWFRIGDKHLKFSKEHYCMYTGLKFGSTNFKIDACGPPPATGVYNTHFKGMSVVLNTLKRKFVNNEFSAEHVLSASYVFIIMHLFGSEKMVPHWIWTIVDLPNEMNKFPWGAYTYQITLFSFTNAFKDKHVRYSVFGYPLALQLWVCECIEGIADLLVLKRNDSFKKFPRLVRWVWKKKKQQICIGPDLAVKQENPTDDDLEKPYMEGIEKPLSEGIQYVHRGPRIRRPRTEKVKRKTTTKKPTKNSDLVHCIDAFKLAMMEKIEDLCKDIKTRLSKDINMLTTCVADVLPHIDKSARDMAIYQAMVEIKKSLPSSLGIHETLGDGIQNAGEQVAANQKASEDAAASQSDEETQSSVEDAEEDEGMVGSENEEEAEENEGGDAEDNDVTVGCENKEEAGGNKGEDVKESEGEKAGGNTVGGEEESGGETADKKEGSEEAGGNEGEDAEESEGEKAGGNTIGGEEEGGGETADKEEGSEVEESADEEETGEKAVGEEVEIREESSKGTVGRAARGVERIAKIPARRSIRLQMKNEKPQKKNEKPLYEYGD